MTAREHRCCHCLRRYCYHPSGDGRPVNDARYCPSCKTAIMEALKAIPHVCEQIWVAVTDPTEAEAVVRHREETLASIAARRAGGELVPERVSFPLYDNTVGGGLRVVHLTHPVQFNGQEYLIREWVDNREPLKVEKPMEKNLTTGAITPWQTSRQ